MGASGRSALLALAAVLVAGCGGTTVVQRPCADICDGKTPICDEATHRCVGCLTDDDCAAGQICAANACKVGCSATRPDCPAGKMCDMKLSVCRGCRADAECTDMANPRCEVAKERCVPCLPQMDNCTGGTRCVATADTYMCTSKCKAKADCMGPGAPATMECCNSLCVDVAASPDHCGACGRSCAGGGKSCCNSACIDTATDVKNCGACGKACKLDNATAGCAASACTVASCNAGFGDCDKQAMDGCEVDLNSTVGNCGACAMACAVPPGGTAACTMGVCAVGMCNAGLADCDQQAANGCEVDTGSNANHCGGCGKACPKVPNALSTCTQGVCGIGACVMGFADCDKVQNTGCEVSTSSDVNNCGACGKSCGVIANGSALCVAGNCLLGSCSPGFKDCNSNLGDGCEINAAIDSSNCGTCGNSCGNTPHASAACVNGACGIGQCEVGWGNCDNLANNGCETPITGDILNCGACGKKCPAPANVAISCVNSVCGMGGCNAGYADCNNNMADGCEARLGDDLKNCGLCGTVCAGMGQNAVAACVMGVCSLACNKNFGNCDGNNGNGCEKDLAADSANCGACGMVCPQGSACSGGKCVSSQTFTQSGTFTVPLNIKSVRALVVGGGGGGANGHQGGGGSGVVAGGTVNVNPGDVITVTLGAGGLGAQVCNGCNNIVGNTAGGNSSFGNLLLANGGGTPTVINGPGGSGGSGGGGSCNGGMPGPAGGSNGNNGNACNQAAGNGQGGSFATALAVIQTVVMSAGQGGAGGNSSHSAGGGGGGVLMNGQGPAGGDGAKVFSAKGGVGYGAGGGGGGYDGNSGQNREAGGNGAPGLVYVEW